MTCCTHPEVHCLNQFELIRKYACADCGAVMMCACDEPIGRRFLTHQLNEGTESQTRRRVPVTAGFQSGVCRECRGQRAEAHPTAPILGRTSKIKRYYWRELVFRELGIFADWADAHGVSPDGACGAEAVAARKMAGQRALEEIKALHARDPKYVFAEESQEEVIRRYGVNVVDLSGVYLTTGIGQKAQLLDENEAVSAEGLVARHYQRQGYSVLFLESRPFHVLFGIYMWLLIQDPADPLIRSVGFGNRNAFETGSHGSEMIWTVLPEDFGSRGYGERRARAIDKHLTTEMSKREELKWLFDYWREPSKNLRQYLWAHREEDMDLARKLIEVLPGSLILRILRYLVGDYWGRYLGWPDLLAHRGLEFLFIEVKGSGDKLTEDQKSWIRGNHEILKLPFAIAKIHKKSVVDIR